MHRAVLNSATIASSHPKNGASVGQLLPNGTPQDGFLSSLGFGADNLETVRGLTYQDHNTGFGSRVPAEHEDVLLNGSHHTPEWIIPSESDDEEEESEVLVDGIAISVKHFNRNNDTRRYHYSEEAGSEKMELPQPPDSISYSDEEEGKVLFYNSGVNDSEISDDAQNSAAVLFDEGLLETANEFVDKSTHLEDLDISQKQLVETTGSFWGLANYITSIRNRTSIANSLNTFSANNESTISPTGVKAAPKKSNEKGTTFLGSLESRYSSTKNAVASTIVHYSSRTNKLFSNIENEILNVALGSVLPSFLPSEDKSQQPQPSKSTAPEAVAPLPRTSTSPTTMTSSQKTPTRIASSNDSVKHPEHQFNLGGLPDLSHASLLRW